MIGKHYATQALGLAQAVIDGQFDKISESADRIYESLKNGGLLHVFGCGHSHMLAEECFYRAGGLVPVNPIFETSAMLHEGAVKSSQIERMSGYAPLILDNYDLRPGEVILIFSTSGINAMPVEMALEAKKRGLSVIAVTSLNYDEVASRSPDGKRLHQCADIVINNNVPVGDAMVQLEKSGLRAVPGSTIVSATVLNTIIAEILERFEANEEVPPVFCSGNIDGGFEKNKEYIDGYRYRVKSL